MPLSQSYLLCVAILAHISGGWTLSHVPAAWRSRQAARCQPPSLELPGLSVRTLVRVAVHPTRAFSLSLCGAVLTLNSRRSTHQQESADIWPTARLLLDVFAPEGGLNALQGSLVRAEHVVGLRERMRQNTMLVGTTAEGKVVGFVEVRNRHAPARSGRPSAPRGRHFSTLDYRS